MENNQTAESNIVESVTETPQPVPATMQDFIQKRFINKYVVVRTTNAGVFFGLLKVYENRCAVVEEARRIWRWVGAASLSQLAMEGVKSPDECKIPREVDYVMLEEVIEVIPLREDAKINLYEVPEWKAEQYKHTKNIKNDIFL